MYRKEKYKIYPRFMLTECWKLLLNEIRFHLQSNKTLLKIYKYDSTR